MFKIKESDVLAQYKKTMLILLVIAQLLLALAIPAAADLGKTFKSEIIDNRIEKGLQYLHKNQLPSGEFPTYISYSPDINNGTNETTVFDTGFILHTLSLADEEHSHRTHKIVQDMKTKAVAFLLANKESHNVWRFWGTSQPYLPPDTDVTAAVFSALIESGVNISDESLDYMLDFRTPDGVFYTWINSEEWLDPSNPYYEYYKINDIDANVNLDVLYAYSLRNRTLSGVTEYLNNITENESFLNGTLYYPSPYVFSYLVTKAYSDGNVTELQPALDNIEHYILTTQQPDGGWGNDLYTALATVSLINMGYEGEPLENAIMHILKNQKRNGSWEKYAFYIRCYPIIYYGSHEITTSFSLEALIKYKNGIDRDFDEYRDKK